MDYLISMESQGYQVRFALLQSHCRHAGCLIVIGIAIPFAVSGVRVSPVVGFRSRIGLFFLYYLLANLANLIGGREMLTPRRRRGCRTWSWPAWPAGFSFAYYEQRRSRTPSTVIGLPVVVCFLSGGQWSLLRSARLRSPGATAGRSVQEYGGLRWRCRPP